MKSNETQSGQPEVALKIRSENLPVKGMLLVALTGREDPLDWCREMCNMAWGYESSDLGETTLHIYCFYFTSMVDYSMFKDTFQPEIKLASLAA